MFEIKKYDFISTIISYMISNEFISTINNLSASISIPKQYIRKAIIALISNSVLKANIEPGLSACDNEKDLLDLFIDDPKLFSHEILSGNYDEIEWTINLNILSSKDNLLLPLSHIENSALASIGENPITIKRGTIFEKKDTTKPISAKLLKIKADIQEAIESGKAISFIYTDSMNNKSAVKCLPAQLVTNITDNWVYFTSTSSRYPFRLDRISHYYGSIPNDGSYPPINYDDKQKYFWGSPREIDAEPMHVKLQISPETSNIIAKIRNDIAFRHQTCSFYFEGSFFYYEDDIIGIDEFQRWIRGYGSSIIVLEPEFLRSSIVERAKETLSLYERSKNWGDL